MYIVEFASVLSMILLFWFKTNAFIEYGRLLGLGSFFDKYEEKRNQDFTLTFPNYLSRFRPCFFTRLLSCPICFNTWLSIITGLIFWLNVPLLFVVSISIYLIISALLTIGIPE